MVFRPAGDSDDEYNSDLDDEDFFQRSRGNYRNHRPPTNNGGPKTVEEAIKDRDGNALQRILQVYIARNTNFDHKLIFACACSPWPEGVQILLQNGANPNIEQGLSRPLTLCCQGGRATDEEALVECVNLLLAHGANPNLTDRYGRTPILLAAQEGLLQILNSLLAFPDTDLTAVDPAGHNVMFHAQHKNRKEIVERLVAAGLPPELPVNADVQEPEEEICEITVAQMFSNRTESQLYVQDTFAETVAKKSLQSFLEVLPDDGGGGGFYDSVLPILESAGCRDVLHAVPLPLVLSANEPSLERLGVQFTYTRENIMKSVHQLHLRKWETGSLPFIPNPGKMGLGEIGDALCTHLRHLVIINAAVEYLRQRVSEADSTDIHLAEVLYKVKLDQTELQRNMQLILDQLNKINTIEESPIDYCGQLAKINYGRRRSITFTVLSSVLAFFTATYRYLFIRH